MRTTQANHVVNSAKTKSVYLKGEKRKNVKICFETKSLNELNCHKTNDAFDMSVVPTAMKYIGYCRKSTDEKEKQVLSIDQQIFELKEFALREKIEIVDFLIEKQSAKVTGRKVFGSLIERIDLSPIK